MTLHMYPELRDRRRLLDVARLGVDRPRERPGLAGIVEAVTETMETPFAVVTALLDDAQVFLAGSGPIPGWIAEAGGTPVEWAFCSPMLRSQTARSVSDFTRDPEFRGNPLVTIEGVRAYVGAPLISSGGQVLGGLCGLDVRPRDDFGPDRLRVLQGLADEAVRLLEAGAEPDTMVA